jgi:hypothetical protein
VRKKRQQLLSFLLRHDRIFSGREYWSPAHRRWLAEQNVEHPAQQIVFQDAIDAIEDGAARLRRLEEQLLAIAPSWSMAPVVAAYQVMRGVSFIVAVTFVAEIGDVRRYDNPRQLMLVRRAHDEVFAKPGRDDGIERSADREGQAVVDPECGSTDLAGIAPHHAIEQGGGEPQAVSVARVGHPQSCSSDETFDPRATVAAVMPDLAVHR